MRVGVDARSLLCDHPRGEGKALLRLYQGLSSLRPEWEFVFYGQGEDRDVTGIANMSVSMFDLPGFRFNAWENIGLPYTAWMDRVDVLHCAGSSAPWAVPKPVILTVHDLIPLVFDDGIPKSRIAEFKRQLNYGLHSAKHVIAVSENTKRDIVRLFGTDPEKISVIYWGCESRKHQDKDAQKSVSTGSMLAGLKKPYVMAFGGEAIRKNTETVIRAYAEIAKQITGVRFVLIGLTDPASNEKYGRLVRACGIAEQTTILGYVTEEDLEEIYRNAACFLYPSFYEGFGLPVLEAMSRGVPVVASSTSSIPELVGEAGLLIDPRDCRAIANAVASILNDDALRARLKTLGLQRAEKFSWMKTAGAYVEIFEKVYSSCLREHDRQQ